MISTTVAFGIAVAGTSLICYALMTRAEKIKRNRRSAGDSVADGASSDGAGWAGWSGGHHSVPDSSGNPGDFSGGDSGGGGDAGGGDGGGGAN